MTSLGNKIITRIAHSIGGLSLFYLYSMASIMHADERNGCGSWTPEVQCLSYNEYAVWAGKTLVA